MVLRDDFGDTVMSKIDLIAMVLFVQEYISSASSFYWLVRDKTEGATEDEVYAIIESMAIND